MQKKNVIRLEALGRCCPASPSSPFGEKGLHKKRHVHRPSREGHHFNPAAHFGIHPPPPLCVTSQNQPSSSLFFSPLLCLPRQNFTLLLFFSLLSSSVFIKSRCTLPFGPCATPWRGTWGIILVGCQLAKQRPLFGKTRPPPAPKAYCHHTQWLHTARPAINANGVANTRTVATAFFLLLRRSGRLRHQQRNVIFGAISLSSQMGQFSFRFFYQDGRDLDHGDHLTFLNEIRSSFPVVRR